jgi:hypothetical protein
MILMFAGFCPAGSSVDVMLLTTGINFDVFTRGPSIGFTPGIGNRDPDLMFGEVISHKEIESHIYSDVTRHSHDIEELLDFSRDRELNSGLSSHLHTDLYASINDRTRTPQPD